VLAAGADFQLLGPRRTMIESTVPVIAVVAVRTGCGKSQTARIGQTKPSLREIPAGVVERVLI
jgi:predicted GTPase